MTQAVPPALQLAGGLFALVAALIATYKFVVQRPQVRLDAAARRSSLRDDGVRSTLAFELSNRGLRHAEDVYVELRAADWDFGEQRRTREWEWDVSVVDAESDSGSESESESGSGSMSESESESAPAAEGAGADRDDASDGGDGADGDHVSDGGAGADGDGADGDGTADRDEASDGDDASGERPAGEADAPDGDAPGSSTSVRAVDTVLDVRHDLQTYFLAPGEVNHVFVDDVLYAGAEFSLFVARGHFEQFRTYELTYAVGCRTYGPRTGTVEIEVGYDDVAVTNRRPRFWRAWAGTVAKIGRDLVDLAADALDATVGFTPGRADVRVVRTAVESDGEVPDEVRLTPVAVVENRPRSGGRRSVDAKATLTLRDGHREAVVGTVTFTAYALLPGQQWETRPPRQQWGTNLFDSTVDYADGPREGALPVVLTVPDDSESRPDLAVEWTVDAWEPRTGDLRGLAVLDCEYREGDRTARATIRNRNGVDVTLFAIAHFHAADRTVLTTPYREVTVAADGEAEVRIAAGLAPEQSDRIAGCDVVLSNAL